MLSRPITSKNNARWFSNIHKRSLSDRSPYLVWRYTHSTDPSGRDPLAQMQFKSTKLPFHETCSSTRVINWVVSHRKLSSWRFREKYRSQTKQHNATQHKKNNEDCTFLCVHATLAKKKKGRVLTENPSTWPCEGKNPTCSGLFCVSPPP